jgi:hypothetical protein
MQAGLEGGCGAQALLIEGGGEALVVLLNLYMTGGHHILKLVDSHKGTGYVSL